MSLRIIFFLFLIASVISAQDSRLKPLQIDSSGSDSLIIRDYKLYVVSADSIEVPVDYQSKDSIIFDYNNKWIHLYGDASVKYQTMTLRADYIRIDMNSSIAYAEPLMDSLGQKTGIPKFVDGNQSFDAQKIRYNFKSRKGIITQIVTKETDIYIHGETTKFISKQSAGSDGDDIIYNKNGIFTTCDNPEPHFGIYSNKQKIIPNKLIIIGPSIVKIKGIPTPPFMLPFGFFPISKDRSSGLIFPRNYDFDPRYGFGLREIGYYFPINDFLDLKVLTDIWFKGSLRILTAGNYNKKYKYNGNFSLEYSYLKERIPNDYRTITKRPLRLSWRHAQAQTAHPYRSFSGDVNISTGSFDRVVFQDARNRLNSQLRSNLTYNYQFPNSPFSLIATFNHDQNLNTGIINMTLPQLDVRMRPITPFKNNKKISAQPNWYERINLNYNSSLTNRFSTLDTNLFKQSTLDTMQYGVKHSASLDASFRILKYFSLTPGINYYEEWFNKKRELTLLDTMIIRKDVNGNTIDTLFGLEQNKVKRGFYAYRNISANLNLSTQIYGQVLSKKGWFRGIRHVIAPSLNASFAPDYSKAPFNYSKYVDTDTRAEKMFLKKYLVYQGSPFGTSNPPAENFQINYSVNNRVELKYYSKKDSSFKKIPIIENFSFGGNYNVFADSFKLSNISGVGRNSIFKGLTTLTYSITVDPYQRILSGNTEIRKNAYLINTDKKLFNVVSASFGIVNSATVGQIFRLIKKQKPVADGLPSLENMLETFSLNHNMQYSFVRQTNGKDTFKLDYNSISTSGNIPITKNWSARIGQIGYDFLRKAPTYPDFGLVRNLHCWTMEFQYYPQSRAFSFFIGVRPGSLDFIKIPNNQNITGGR
ncbi:MAG: LPS-assembly protein LptD [Saprospiraceae bacterium]|nr:LPS-assembly protein LptD [Candidatus Vicinibacter affinis]